MSEDEERTYTFFHEDGPIRLSEHELLNEYMRLRGEVADVTHGRNLARLDADNERTKLEEAHAGYLREIAAISGRYENRLLYKDSAVETIRRALALCPDDFPDEHRAAVFALNSLGTSTTTPEASPAPPPSSSPEKRLS